MIALDVGLRFNCAAYFSITLPITTNFHGSECACGVTSTVTARSESQLPSTHSRWKIVFKPEIVFVLLPYHCGSKVPGSRERLKGLAMNPQPPSAGFIGVNPARNARLDALNVDRVVLWGIPASYDLPSSSGQPGGSALEDLIAEPGLILELCKIGGSN
jgi:hypothetical protein